MAKYNNKHFLQLPRAIFTDKYKDLSNGAKWLYVVLNELEQRYTSGRQNGKGYFYRSDKELANDAGMCEKTLRKYKKELKEKAPDLLNIEVSKYIEDEKTQKLSEESITFYTIY